MPELPQVLFVGWGVSVVSYYRCFLPAIVLGADYVAATGEPPNLVPLAGLGERVLTPRDFFDYDVVVVQQPRGLGWMKFIRRLQDAGVVVLYEIDDYIQGARKYKLHELSHQYGVEVVRGMEMSMRVCDGIICSTPYLARRYRAFNARTWACPNGIDLKRYAGPRPPHEGVTIGWAGGIGHKASLARWESAVRAVLRQRPQTRVMSVGYLFANDLVEEFGPERAIALPPSQIETYPSSMKLFDIAIAPSGENNVFRGKSDLRWLEASALKLPLVAHPELYPDVRDGETGLLARTSEEAEAALLKLVDDPELRRRVGAAAYDEVSSTRRIEVMADNWAEVIREVAPVRAP